MFGGDSVNGFAENVEGVIVTEGTLSFVGKFGLSGLSQKSRFTCAVSHFSGACLRIEFLFQKASKSFAVCWAHWDSFLRGRAIDVNQF